MSFERDLRRLEHEAELARLASFRRARFREPGSAEAEFVPRRPSAWRRRARVAWRVLRRVRVTDLLVAMTRRARALERSPQDRPTPALAERHG